MNHHFHICEWVDFPLVSAGGSVLLSFVKGGNQGKEVYQLSQDIKNLPGQTQSWVCHTCCSSIVHNWNIHFTLYKVLQKATQEEYCLGDNSDLLTRNCKTGWTLKSIQFYPSPIGGIEAQKILLVQAQGKQVTRCAQNPGFLISRLLMLLWPHHS